jgi:hypothetical protein
MDDGAGAGLRPLGIGEILDVSIKLFRKDFRALLKAVALVTVPVQILSAIVLESATLDIEDMERTDAFGYTTLEIDAGEVWTFIAAILLSSVLVLISSQLASAACFKMMAGRYLDEQVTWRESLRFAVSKLRPLIWLSLLLGFLTLLATLALVIPGIYFYAAWTVAVPVLLLEDLRGRKALKRSRSLVRGRWWSTFGVIIMSAILTSIVGGALSALFTYPLEAAFDSDVLVFVSSTIGATLAGLLTTPFAAAVIIVLYVDLRVRREGFDLELLARRIGSAPPTGPPPAAIFGAAVPVRPAADAPAGEQPPFWPPPPGWTPSAPPAPPPSSLPPPPLAPGSRPSPPGDDPEG